MPSISYITRCLPVFLLLALSSHGQGLFIHNYNVKDGLANATVTDAVQDRDGFIWFATPTGVSKFDGKRFRNYTKRDGLTDNDVTKLAADSRNRVWFFNYSGKLSFYGNHYVHNAENDSSLRFDNQYELKYIFEDRARQLSFLNSAGRVVFYNGRSTLSNKWKGGGTDIFFFLKNDSIYRPLESSFQLASLTELEKRTGKVFTSMPYSLQEIGFVERIRQNAILTHKNVVYSYTAKDVLPFFDGGDFGIHEEISSVCIDRENLWIGTTRALYFIRDFFRGSKKVSKLLNNHNVTSILNDRDGNIWITTYGDGVYHIPYKNFYFSYLDHTNGLESHSVFSVRKDKRDGRLYVGQNGGILTIVDTLGVTRKFSLDSTGGRNSVSFIAPYKPTDYIIGTDNNIFLLDRIRQRVKLLQSIHMIKDIKVTPGGKIRVAAENKLITISDGSSQTIILNTLKAMAVACLGDSAYYLGTNNGLFFGTGDNMPVMANDSDSRLKQSIKDLELIDGYLWVGTSEQGIYLVKNNQVLKQFTSQENLASDICQQLYYDGKDRLYVATNRGVSVIDVKTQSLVRNITSNDGLMSDDIRDIYSDGDTLLIATSNGLCYFNADKIPVDTIPPTIYLNTLRYGDSTYRPVANFTHLYESKGAFEVEFGAIAYDLPDLVDYQYNLSGDTLSWTNTKSNIIPFPDLQPGHYQLLIRARKYRSDWGPPVAININILPRWYQQWWARGILVLLGVLGILVILRFIVRRIKAAEKRKTEYNRRIAELEAKALTNQMNPHFIFNSLNSVQHLILEKEEKQALNFLADFATLMRQMLNNSRKSFISLEDEIAFLTRYLELEKIRFASSFVYQFEIEEELKEYTIYIPPMLLQPILENAIKHGLAPKNGSGRLLVKMQLQNDLLYCAVDDDGIGWEQSNALKSNKLVKHESTAISVIKERLQIIKSFNGSIGKLEIIDKFKSGSGSREGTLVVIRIPIVKML